MSYSFMLVENHRENGKVKQKVVKYLSSFVDEYSYPWITEQSRKDGHKAIQRLFTWLNIYCDLEDVEISNEKLKGVINKINTFIPLPTENDLQTWIKNEWGKANIFGTKYKDSTEKYVNDVTEQFNKMCSAYQCTTLNS